MTGRVMVALLALLGLSVLEVAIRFVGERLRDSYAPPGKLVSLGSYKLHLYCVGSGSPPIVFESGLGTDWTSWGAVAPRLAASNQACVYDRAGYGWSDPGPEPRTAKRLAAELSLLLAGAGVRKPYVLVAHSFGGYVARSLAAEFPGSVSGVVLVDPALEDEPRLSPSLGRRIHNLLPPTGFAGLFRLFEGERAVPAELRNFPPAYRARFMVGASYNEASAERREYNALSETENEMRASVFPRDLPLIVVTAPFIVGPDPGSAEPRLATGPRHVELQARLAQMSSRGKQVVAAGSGHTVQLERPELVLEAVREMSRQTW